MKGNQEKLEEAVHAAFAEALDGTETVQTLVKEESGHGRIETRLCTVIDVPADFTELEKWRGLKSLAMVTREYLDSKGVSHTGVRYYISSLPSRRARRIAEAARRHWAIENQLHWALDVAFKEDVNRSRAAHSQANLGMFRRAALSMLKNAPGLEGSVNSKRQQAGWNEEVLSLVLFGREATQSYSLRTSL